jgi:hypothetical protein
MTRFNTRPNEISSDVGLRTTNDLKGFISGLPPRISSSGLAILNDASLPCTQRSSEKASK